MNNTNHVVRGFPSSLLTGYETYTPAKLREVAAEMEQKGVKSIDLEIEEGYDGWHSVQCRETRLETDKERDKRVEQDRKDDEQRENYERITFERLQRKFGKNQ